MVSSTSVLGISTIPTGGIIVQMKIKFRSPYNYFNEAHYVDSNGYDHNDGSYNVSWNSCGIHSPYLDSEYVACCVENYGSVNASSAFGVQWDSCGVYFFRYFYREIIEFSSSSPERREFSLL